MGMVSVVLIRHDGADNLCRDSQLGQKIWDAILMHHRKDSRDHRGGDFEVLAASIHTTDVATIVVEGNTGFCLEEALHKNDGRLPRWSGAWNHLRAVFRRMCKTPVGPDP
jgi:hypothetical protein